MTTAPGSLYQPALPVARSYLIDLAIFVALTLFAAFFLATPIDSQRLIRIGIDDREVISGIHPAERSAEDGRYFRWTTGAAQLRLPAQNWAKHILALRLAAPQAGAHGIATEIRLGEHPLATVALPARPRVFHLMIPEKVLQPRNNDIQLVSPTFTAPNDPRQLGIVLFEARLSALNAPDWLFPLQVSALGLATLLLMLTLRAAGIGYERAGIAALFVLISLTMRQSDPRFIERWDATIFSLIIAACALAGWALQLAFPAPTPLAAGEHVTPQATGRWHWGWPLAFALIAILQFDQIWPHPGGIIPGPPGDNFEYVWKLQWFADALLQRHTAAFVPQMYYPVGYELAHSEMTPAHTLLGLPVTLLAGPTVSYNLQLFASYLLTGLFVALLATRIGAGRLGAFVAAVGVAFCLYRYARTLAHLPMMGTQWIALALYGLESFIQRRRATDALLAGLGTALAAWSSWYYGVTLPFLLALWLLLRWPWKETRLILAAWRGALVATLVTLALLLPYAQPYMQLRETSQVRHDMDTLLLLAARPVDYLIPSDLHRFWGPLMAESRAQVNGERRMTATLGLLALALVGIWRWRKRGIAWAAAGAGLASAIFSFGPYLELGSFTLPLPALWFYDHVPLLDSIRAWSRVGFYAQLCLGLLAGLGLTGIATWRHLWRALGMLAATLVVIESLNSSLMLSSTEPRALDRWLAQQPGTAAIVQVPDISSGYGEYYSLFNTRPLTIGYGTFPPARSSGDRGLLGSFPSPVAAAAMHRLDIEFMIVRIEVMNERRPGWQAEAAALTQVEQVYIDREYVVYRLRAPER